MTRRHPGTDMAPLMAVWHALAIMRPIAKPEPETHPPADDTELRPAVEVRPPVVPPRRTDRAWRRGEHRKWPGGQP
jgi:hypothetical protein